MITPQPTSVAVNLAQLRQEIDALDTQLLTTLAKRMTVAAAVGNYKKAHNLPPLDQARWQAVLDSRTATGEKLGLPSEFTKTLFELIHTHSLAIQAKIQS
jgi:chorismate mutase